MAKELTFDGLIAARRLRTATRPVFVTEDGQEMTPDAFEVAIGRAAAWLRAQGIGAGDRVAIWLPNCTAWIALLFGAARIGAIVAAVNTRYRTAELHHILASSGARLLIFGGPDRHADFYAMTAALDFSSLPELTALATPDARDLSPIQGLAVAQCCFDGLAPLPAGPAMPSDPVLLFTTSGTTSKPKLVIHTQASMTRHALNCARAYGFDADGARYLAAMPFCGVFGLNPTFAALAGGAPIHVMPTFSVAPALAIARAAPITHFFGSDEMFRLLWQTEPGALSQARLCGFASFTPGLGAILREMAEAGLPLAGVYGASEVNAIFAVQPTDALIEYRLQGGGRPSAPEAEIRVRDVETGALCAVGESGVIEIRAVTNFSGYFRNPAATAKAINAEGFFHTGDVGYLRGDGTFAYLARNGDFIRLSGFLTDPAEIEEVIEEARGVAKAQVVGVAHEGRTCPVAFILPEPGIMPDEAAILAHTAARLAHYKVPVRVITVANFPTTESANGLKIQKTRLRDMAEAYLTEET